MTRSEKSGVRGTYGLKTLYYREDGKGAVYPSLVELLKENPDIEPTLCPEGVAGYLDQKPRKGRCCLKGVRSVPAGYRIEYHKNGFEIFPVTELSQPCLTLLEIFEDEIRKQLSDCGPFALALSGGYDSAFVLGLLCRLGNEMPCVYTIDTTLEGYSESNTTLKTAEHFGVPITVVQVTGEDFIDALPDTIHATETPLYNLHPVSKLLLARRLRADGIKTLFTGDGADQAFSGVESANYIPLIGSIFASEGIRLVSPFLSEELSVYCRKSLVPDPQKRVLRELGRGMVPNFILNQRKRQMLTPPLDLNRYWDEQLIQRLSSEINYPLPNDFSEDIDRTKWITLSLLYRYFMEEKF